MLAHYHWNLVIYLCYIIRIIVVLYYVIITPLPTYLPPYLIHMKAGRGFRPQVTPTVWFWSKAVEGFPKWSTAQVLICGPCRLHLNLEVENSGTVSFQKSSPPPPSWIFQVFNVGGITTITLQRHPHLHLRRIQTLTFQAVIHESSPWLLSTVQHVLTAKWGRKIRLWLMHHDLRFCCIFLGFRRLAPLRLSAFISCPFLTSPSVLAKHSTALRKNHWSCSVHQEYPRDTMQGKMKCCYAFGLPARGRKCAIAADFSGHAHFFRQESLLQLRWRTSVFHHRISMRPVLPCQAEVARALQTFSHGLLTRTSWHFLELTWHNLIWYQ